MSTFRISDKNNNDKRSINDKSTMTLKPSEEPKPYQPRSKKVDEDPDLVEENCRLQRIREFISEKCYLGPLLSVQLKLTTKKLFFTLSSALIPSRSVTNRCITYFIANYLVIIYVDNIS